MTLQGPYKLYTRQLRSSLKREKSYMYTASPREKWQSGMCCNMSLISKALGGHDHHYTAKQGGDVLKMCPNNEEL